MTWPNITPSSMQVTVKSYNQSSESSFSGARYVVGSGGSKITATLTYESLSWDRSGALIGFLAAQRGQLNTFDLPMYDRPTPRGTATGSPTLTGTHAAGLTSLTTTGWTPSITGILKAGDYIKVGTQVLIVTADANSDGSGNSTISVHTPLRNAVSGAVSVNNLTMTVRLTDDNLSWQTALARIRGMTISVEEAY